MRCLARTAREGLGSQPRASPLLSSLAGPRAYRTGDRGAEFVAISSASRPEPSPGPGARGETGTRRGRWRHTIFPNATCATALIDRVVHHADVISIEGDSYRVREAEADAKTRAAKPPKGGGAKKP